jgi:hypothetical protein
VLSRVAELKAAGLSEVKAAKMVGTSPPTLWRWRRRIVPATDRCGRKSPIARFTISDRLISKVQKLRVAGCSNPRAWRALADDPNCPKDLAEFLRTMPAIPKSLAVASRLTKVRTVVLVGKNFTHIPQPLEQIKIV